MYHIRNGQNSRWTKTECACGTRLGNSVYLSWSWPFTIQVERTSWDTYRIPTGCRTHENRTNHTRTGRTAYQHTSNVHPPDIFIRYVQNLPTDRTRPNGYYLTRNVLTAWRTNKKRMNGQRILLSVTRPLALSGKVWQSLNNSSNI